MRPEGLCVGNGAWTGSVTYPPPVPRWEQPSPSLQRPCVKHLLCSLQHCWVDLLLAPITRMGELRLGKAEALRHGLLPSLETPSIGSPDLDEGAGWPRKRL